jgi:hypothetical protein
MMKRTAQGKMIDINALIAKNEKVRAVGNMKANARGDIIDSQGRIVKTASERANEAYTKTVGNKSANVVKNKPNVQEKLTKEELELESSLEDDLEIENIKEKELKNGRK